MLSNSVLSNIDIYFENDSIQIIKLSKNVLEHYINDVILLENMEYEQNTTKYANERWHKINYTKDVEDKWHYSLCAVDKNTNKLVGLCIVSKWSNNLHINRVVIQSEFRGYLSRSEDFSISKLFYSKLDDSAKQDKIKSLTVQVSYDNYAVVKKYIKYGYVILESTDLLSWFVFGKKINAVIENNYLIISGGKNYVMRKLYNYD
jgi:hypothetical protein